VDAKAAATAFYASASYLLVDAKAAAAALFTITSSLLVDAKPHACCVRCTHTPTDEKSHANFAESIFSRKCFI
jgi:hypothetical protein